MVILKGNSFYLKILLILKLILIFYQNNRKYLAKFVDLNLNNIPDIIEIHNRPSYVEIIKKLSSK